MRLTGFGPVEDYNGLYSVDFVQQTALGLTLFDRLAEVAKARSPCEQFEWHPTLDSI